MEKCLRKYKALLIIMLMSIRKSINLLPPNSSPLTNVSLCNLLNLFSRAPGQNGGDWTPSPSALGGGAPCACAAKRPLCLLRVRVVLVLSPPSLLRFPTSKRGHAAFWEV